MQTVLTLSTPFPQRLGRFGEAVDHKDQRVREDAGRPPGQSVGASRQPQRRQDGDGLCRL